MNIWLSAIRHWTIASTVLPVKQCEPPSTREVHHCGQTQTTGPSHQRCSSTPAALTPAEERQQRRACCCLPSCQCGRWRHPGPSAAPYWAPVHGWTPGLAGFAGRFGSSWTGRSAFRSADAAPPPSSVGGQYSRHLGFTTETSCQPVNVCNRSAWGLWEI